MLTYRLIFAAASQRYLSSVAQIANLPYRRMQGFVPRLVEKQLAESFITRLSSQEQVWSDGFEEPG